MHMHYTEIQAKKRQKKNAAKIKFKDNTCKQRIIQKMHRHRHIYTYLPTQTQTQKYKNN